MSHRPHQDNRLYENDEFPWLLKEVHGAMKSAVDNHGPITRKSAFKAAQRVRNQLYQATTAYQVGERLEAAARREIALRKENDDLKLENERLRLEG